MKMITRCINYDRFRENFYSRCFECFHHFRATVHDRSYFPLYSFIKRPLQNSGLSGRCPFGPSTSVVTNSVFTYPSPNQRQRIASQQRLSGELNTPVAVLWIAVRQPRSQPPPVQPQLHFTHHEAFSEGEEVSQHSRAVW